MRICTNCGHENPEGKLYCENCGLAVVEVEIGTHQLDEPGALSAGSEKLDEEHVAIFHIQGHEDPVTIKILDRVILGRTGGESSRVVLINLDHYGAETKGVSRRHALLEREGERLYISDLGSTNHTFLNGQQLLEHDHLVVRDGDQLRLGHLSMRIFFK
jgi:hypothetical protein